MINHYDRRKRAHAKVRRFCGTACWYAYIRDRPDEATRWRGGFEPYYGPNWERQKRLARQRDSYTCGDCGLHQTDPALDVHHLVPRRFFNRDFEAANHLDNLITPCKACHTRRESELHRRLTEGRTVLLWRDRRPELIYLAV